MKVLRGALVALCASSLLSACAVVAPRPAHVTVEHLDPAQAFRVLENSRRSYKIRMGRLSRDSLVAPFANFEPVQLQDLPAAMGDVWEQAVQEALSGSPQRSAYLFGQIVNAEPTCAACRVEYARALLGLANGARKSPEKAAPLRSLAGEQLAIAGTLDGSVPSAGGFYPPSSAGRTDIRPLPRSQRAGELYAAGNDAFNSGEFAQALSLYGLVIQNEPDFGRGYVALGDVSLEMGNAKEAAEYYSRSLRQDSTDFVGWRSLAECFLLTDNVAAAKEAAVWAVINNYADAESWRLLSEIGNKNGFSVNRQRISKRVEMREIQGNAVEILLDSLSPGPSQTAWFAYGAIRAVWRYEGRFVGRFPRAERFFSGYAEETEALASLAVVWHTAIADTLPSEGCDDLELERLWRIIDGGFLNEYVLFEELCADNPDVVRSFSPSQLRRIREYINRYVIGGVPI